MKKIGNRRERRMEGYGTNIAADVTAMKI
jgi:hypothetical protein